jgi:hypothetical protein
MVARRSPPRDLTVASPWQSLAGAGTYEADWFEVTNTGATNVDITGWTVDEYLVISFHDATNGIVGGLFGLGFGTIVNDD